MWENRARFGLDNYYSFKKLMFLFNPENFVLFTAESLNTFLKTSSVISSQSFLVMDNNSGCGLNNGSLCDFENRFQGQTSWHTSQPNIQSSIFPLNSEGIFSFNSMVK